MIPFGMPINMHCPRVQSNVFVGNPNDFADYQIVNSIQVSRLSIAGICADASDVPRAATGWEVCVGLGVTPRRFNSPCLSNARSLVDYIACEYSSCVMLGKGGRLMVGVLVVMQACVAVPDLFEPSFVETLGLGTQSTLAIDVSSAGLPLKNLKASPLIHADENAVGGEQLNNGIDNEAM